LLLRSASDGVHIIDADANVLEVSDSFCQMLGYSREELIGANASLWDAQWSPQELKHKIAEQLGKEGRSVFETRHRRRDGGVLDVEVSGQSLELDGKPVLFNSARNITERKRAERLLGLEHTVARCLADAGNASEALKAVIRAICETKHWECGRYFRVDDKAGVLRFSEYWSVPDPVIQGLIEVSCDITYGLGVALSGTVWQSGHSLWIADITKDARAQTTVFAVKSGMRGAFAFPVKSEGKTIGVFVFNSREVREPDTRLQDAVLVIGSQIGQFLQRKGVEAERIQLTAIVENSNDAIISRALDGNILSWNASAERLFGYSAAETIGRSSDFIIPPGRQSSLARNTEKILRGELVAPHETNRMTKDGRVIDVLVSHSPIKNEAGKIIGISVIFHDISALKQAENQLLLHAAALDAAANAIIITARDGTICWTNPAFTKLTGYSAEEMIGQNPRILKSGRQDAEFYRTMYATILSGAVWQGEILNRYKDGRLGFEEQTITPVRGEAGNGEITHFIAIKQDITKRKQADEAQAMLVAIIENSNDAIISRTLDGKILSWNAGAERLFGYSAAEAIGWPIEEKIHLPETHARIVQNIEKVRRGETVAAYETRCKTKDGRAVDVLSSVSPLRNSAGEVIGASIIMQDISAIKQAEAAIKINEDRFRATFEQAAVGIVHNALDRSYLAVNQKFCDMLGYTRDELLAMHSNEILHPDEQVGSAESKRLLAGEIDTYSGDKRYLRKDGTTLWVHRTVSVARDGSGKPLYLIRVVEDITERKAAERQLREQNEILSNSHEGVMIVNLANEVSLWNRGAEEIFGWTVAEALGRPPEELLGIDDPGIMSTLRAAVERDGFWNGELHSQTRDGRKLIVDCRVTLVRDEAGQPRARLTFLADITEKKLLEEKFLHAQRLESIGMLAAGIAHDLNNVLAPIVFSAPMLRDSLSAPRDLKILDTLERSAERGAGLVTQILGFAHTTTGELRPTQVKHLARDIISVIEETFPKSIQLQQQISSVLWPVEGNATQIHQVLLNLCVNARDAMPQGGTLRIAAANRRLDAAEAGTIPGARPGAWVVLEVADTGTGIPPELLERIWEPFFTTKDAGKGTGLGLSTVRSIVASHDGFVEMHTEPGRGTTFRVFLPAVESESPRPSSASPIDIPDGHGELILVVDDDAAIRYLVAAILEKHGYRVVSCGDGVEAISFFGTHHEKVAMVVTDVDMPRLGGVALARVLLQLRPDIRLLAMSGLSRGETDGSDIQAVQKLAHAFLLKPFQPEDLLGAVHHLLHPSRKP
jgi:PAS domain S-box-containing protein